MTVRAGFFLWKTVIMNASTVGATVEQFYTEAIC